MKVKYVEAKVETDRNYLVITASIDGMSNELERQNFLPGDIVAIVRLSDLEFLLANQRSVA